MKALVFIAGLLIAGSASASCIEGHVAYFTKKAAYGDKEVTYARVCKNGTFMNAEEQAAYIYNPRTTCTEGSRAFFIKKAPYGDKDITVSRVCKNGTFMNAEERAAYVRNPKTTCVEGSYGFARASDYFRNLTDKAADKTITVVCQSNKWIPVRAH